MDKMDLSQIVINFFVIEHGLINLGIAHVCDNTMLMISTLAISTIKVVMAKLKQLKLLSKKSVTMPVSKVTNNV